MTHCEQESSVSDYLDNNLSQSARQSFRTHLETCSECRTALAAFRDFENWGRSYVAPEAPSDPWQHIEAQIRTRQPSRIYRFRSYLSVAASLAVLLVAGALAWQLGVSPNPAAAPPIAPTADFTRPVIDDNTYSARLAELESLLEQSRDVLDARTLAVVESRLRDIGVALEEISSELESDPSNALLFRLSQINRQRQIDLLEKLTRTL